MLYVNLLIRITRECDIHMRQYTFLQPLLPFDLIQKVCEEVLITVEQPRFTISACLFPFLQEGPKRGNTSTRSDHNERCFWIGRKLEIRVIMDIYGQGITWLYTL